MRAGSLLAIYFLFWAFSFFLVLPFRLQRKGGDGSPDIYVPGTTESAPPRFSFGRTAFWTTIVSAVLFGLFYANFVEGWLPASAFDFVPRSLLDD